MLVDPGGVAAGLASDLEDGVDAHVAVRIDGGAVVVGIAGQVVGIDASPAVELGQIAIDLLIETNLGALYAFLAGGGTAGDSIRRCFGGRSEDAVIGNVVPEAGCLRRTACDEGCEAREGIGGKRG